MARSPPGLTVLVIELSALSHLLRSGGLHGRFTNALLDAVEL